MPTDEERLRSAQLRVATPRGADEVRAAAARAQQAGKRTMNNSIKAVREGDDFMGCSFRGPGGLVEQLAFTLRWETGPDSTVIVTQAHDYMTTRSTMFGFIPYGPTKVPALRSFEQFSEWMRKELKP